MQNIKYKVTHGLFKSRQTNENKLSMDYAGESHCKIKYSFTVVNSQGLSL